LTIEASTLAHLGDFQRCVVVGIDETLPIINKPKHPKKGEYKEQNGRTRVQEDKRTT